MHRPCYDVPACWIIQPFALQSHSSPTYGILLVNASPMHTSGVLFRFQFLRPSGGLSRGLTRQFTSNLVQHLYNTVTIPKGGGNPSPPYSLIIKIDLCNSSPEHWIRFLQALYAEFTTLSNRGFYGYAQPTGPNSSTLPRPFSQD